MSSVSDETKKMQILSEKRNDLIEQEIVWLNPPQNSKRKVQQKENKKGKGEALPILFTNH